MPLHLPGRRGAFKYHFSVHVDRVVLREGVSNPPGHHFRILWTKGNKVAMTKEAAASDNTTGSVAIDDTVSLVCTMYRDANSQGGTFASKEASFTLLHCRDGKAVRNAKSLGLAKVNLAVHAGLDTTIADLSLTLRHDGVPVGDCHLQISSRWLKNYTRHDGGGGGGSLVSDDSASEASSYSVSEAGGSESSGWPGGGEDGDGTDADFSDVASSHAGDDDEEDGDGDPDTEDELDAREAAAARRRASGEAGAVTTEAAAGPLAPAATAMKNRMPRLRFGGFRSGAAVPSGVRSTKARAEEVAALEQRVVEAQSELSEMQRVSLEAASEADRVEAALDQAKLDLENARAQLAAKDSEAAAAAASAAAKLAACDAAAAAAEADRRDTLSAAEREVQKLRAESTQLADELEAAREAIRCLEAGAAAAATDRTGTMEQVEAAAAGQAKLDAALRRAEAALAESEGRASSTAAKAVALGEEAARWREAHTAVQVDLAEQSGLLAAAKSAECDAVDALRTASSLLSEEEACRERNGAEEISSLVHAAVHLSPVDRSLQPGQETREGAGRSAAKGANERAAVAALLQKAGFDANEEGVPGTAKRFFEGAYLLQPRASLLLSIGNMSLKLHRPEAAAEAYRVVIASTLAAEPQANDGAAQVEAFTRRVTAGVPRRAFVAPPTDAEFGLATRKEAEAAHALGRQRRSRRLGRGHSSPDAGTAPASATAPSLLGATGDAADGAAPPNDGKELWRRVLLAESAARALETERTALRAEIQELKQPNRRLRGDGTLEEGEGRPAFGDDDGAGARIHRSGSSGGDAISRRLDAQLERLQTELKAARAAAAEAQKDRAELGAQLLQQQRLQRKSKVRQLTDREKLTALEVKLRTRQSEESEEHSRIREILTAQGEQIVDLQTEKEALQAKISALEASR